MKKLILLATMCLMALTMNAQKCAVLEFRGSQSVSVSDVDGISEMFMTYFRPSGYTMVERAQIDKVISEQGFQRSSITDAQAVRVGKILNVSKVVLGKVSRLGGQYQVDVRVVDVESGHDVALDGATFTGDYRTNVRNLAQKLASKIAIRQGGSVSASASVSTQTVRKRDRVEVLYGYLKIYPKELGVFQAEPSSVIAQINKQAQHGYNNWRLPTNEELSLMRANNYLGDGEYMTRESKRGNVLLVTDGKDYQTLQAEEARRVADERAREKAKAEEQARKKAEARRAELKAQGFVDLGLPSGTWWKDENENRNAYYYRTYEQAISCSGGVLPTKGQFEELINKCTWTWTGKGYRVTGPNNHSIFLPAAGYSDCDGKKGILVGTHGMYWSSTPTNSDAAAWDLNFDSYSGRVDMNPRFRCCGLSVRLVQKQ